MRAFERRVLDSPRWRNSMRIDAASSPDLAHTSFPSSTSPSPPISLSQPRHSLAARGLGDFVIWGAGRDGRQFLNGLRPEYRARVACLVDVDEAKIANSPYVNGGVPGSQPVEIRHWRDTPKGLPIVLCVAMGRTGGAFEENVRELANSRGLVETVDYWHFI